MVRVSVRNEEKNLESSFAMIVVGSFLCTFASNEDWEVVIVYEDLLIESFY